MMKSEEQYSSLEMETGDTSREDMVRRKGKAPIIEAPLIGKGVQKSSEEVIEARGGGMMKRGMAIIDFVMRLFALAAVLAASIAMGTTEQTLPFFTQFFQFQAKFYDLPSFT